MAGAGDAAGAFLGALAGGGGDSDDQSNLSRTIGRKVGAPAGSGSNLSRWLGSKFGSKGDAKAPGEVTDNATTMKGGGRVKKTGVYRVHKGEVVIPAKIVKAMDKVARGKRKPVRKSSRASSRR